MKINHLFSALMGATIILIASCNKSHQVIPDAIPVQIDGEETWSLMTADGTIIAENEFLFDVNAAYHGRFVAKDSDGFYIYDIADYTKPLNDEPFLNLSNFISGYAYGVREQSGILVVDREGYAINELPDVITAIHPAYYSNSANLLVYTDSNNKMGYITPSGEIAIEAKWDDAMTFSEGKAMVKEEDGRWICINTDGNKLFKLKKGETPENVFCSNWLPVRGESRYRLVDGEGHTVVKLQPEQTIKYLCHNNLVVIYDREIDKNVLIKDIDIDNGTKIKNFYDIRPIDMSGHRFLARRSQDSKYIIVDENGEKVSDTRFAYSTVLNFERVLATDEFDNPYQIYDCNGKLLNDYLEISICSNGDLSPIKSQKVYNKAFVIHSVDLIKHHSHFGDGYILPEITGSISASHLFEKLNHSPIEVSYMSGIEYNYEIFRKEIFNDMYLTIAFSQNSLDYIWPADYSFTDATPIICALSMTTPHDEADATMRVLSNELKNSGWQQIDSSNHIFESPIGHQIHITKNEYDVIALYAFSKAYTDKWTDSPTNYGSTEYISSLISNQSHAQNINPSVLP